jgi:PAS domain S-box-containing protein
VWLNAVEKETLARLIREGECCHIAAGLDGEIYWASDAFCDWSGYTLFELAKIGWIKLSKDDDNLAADKNAAAEMKIELRSSYQVEKQYITKTGTAHWGLLHVRRVPVTGPFQYAWCHWTPFKNGTATAFSRAMDFQSTLEKRLSEMTAELKNVTSQTDDDKFIIGAVRMIQRHPKLAALMLAIMLSIFGLNNVLELVQRVGIIQAHEVKAEK